MSDKRNFEKLWQDEKNWKGIWGIYYCPEDRRVVVPKRCKWAGWTVNFAHRLAWWSILIQTD